MSLVTLWNINITYKSNNSSVFSSSLPSSSLLSVSSTNKGKIFSIFCVDILKAKVKVACFIFILKILNFFVRLVRHRLVLFSFCAGGRSLYLLIGNLPVEYANTLLFETQYGKPSRNNFTTNQDQSCSNSSWTNVSSGMTYKNL